MKAYLVGTKQGAYIVRALRRLFLYWPPRREVRKLAFSHKFGGVEWYRCNSCKRMTERTDTHVDHIIPVVDPAVGIRSWDEYISRLFCDEENLVILCKSCHRKKTRAENVKRVRRTK